ncbi:MAG: biopolymer transporter ExbD [Spirochaetia bacterium]|uniref:ExbD/TolR family protein n=1 Tax=Treponema berlinense TaxID=225004 RepID=UPI0026EEE901|nr:biopolymer transporter ExbD [Treponema berlinense]MDD5789040.1 biopolymer transporter ExbD [Spirochaetia bacterium]
MKIRRRKNTVPGVDLTPMIDVVFQLILFFLVSTTFAVLPAINVNLPESETSQAQPVAGITVTATSDGRLFFNEEKVTVQTLDKKLKNFDTEGKKREEYPVTLEADEKVMNGTIVKIFDVLRKNGFVAVNLRTTD